MPGGAAPVTRLGCRPAVPGRADVDLSIDQPVRLTVEDVSHTYRGGREALRSVSFEVGAPVVALLGPNGAGTPDALKRGVSGDAVTLTLGDRSRTAEALVVVGGLDGADGAAVDGARVHVRVPHGGEALPALLRALDGRGIALEAAEVRRPTLDDVFLSLTGRSLRDTPAA